jgi:hypothetical protein
MPTITLKEVPSALHEALKRQAHTHRRSLNQEILHCLEQITASSIQPSSGSTDPDRRRWHAASESALLRTWDNPSDDVYNELLTK